MTDLHPGAVVRAPLPGTWISEGGACLIELPGTVGNVPCGQRG